MRKLAYIFFLLLFVQCKEKYNVFITVPDRGILVVEGFVNGVGKTRITLSRTTQLSEKRIEPEPRAVMRIEGENGDEHYLYETNDGQYETDSILLNPSSKYRLYIFTDNRGEYATDFRSIIQTPAIDSITYQYENGIVNFFSHSQNAADRSIFYKWDYDETWEFLSTFRTKLRYKITGEGLNKIYEVDYYDTINRTYNDSIDNCWKNNKSTGIILGSAAQLGDENINLPVRSLPRNAWQLSYVYSILVKQYGLAADSYEFYRRMKKNSESLGTIFDAQPSQLVGNVQCVTTPGEEVIGFIEFCTVSEKRFFVTAQFIPGVPYQPDCPFYEELDRLFPIYPYANEPGVVIQVYNHRDLLPTVPEFTDPFTKKVLTFYAEKPMCVDCTLLGSNIKPDFWP